MVAGQGQSRDLPGIAALDHTGRDRGIAQDPGRRGLVLAGGHGLDHIKARGQDVTQGHVHGKGLHHHQGGDQDREIEIVRNTRVSHVLLVHRN